METIHAPCLTALFLALIVILATTGCELAGGIFKAGFWVGVVIAVVVVAGLLAFASRLRG